MNRLFERSGLGIRYAITKEMIRIESDRPLVALSSAVFGGGAVQAKRIVNRHVDKFYDARIPETEIQEWLNNRGIPGDGTLVLLTAAHVDRGALTVLEEDTFRLAVFATAGVGNAARACPQPAASGMDTPGTVNVILLVDGELSPAAMVGAVITATEAKTAAFQDLCVRDKSGNLATGTTTDAIVVAATQRRSGGFWHRYSGPASPLGAAVASGVYRAVWTAVIRERELAERNGE